MRRLMFITTAALAALCAAPARADEDEIVVTATRQPTPSERLPARVEVIDRAKIEANGIVSLTDAIGADAVQAGGAAQQASVFLRGSNSKHVLALFDGVRLNDSGAPNGQYDFGADTLGALERVEVLRGPASTIYGSDAIGGVVNLIPRRGGDGAFEPFLELSGGSFATSRGLVGARGSADGLDYGVSAEMYRSDGYDLVPARMSTHTGDRDGAAVDTATASARWRRGAVAIDALVRYRDSTAAYDTFSGGAFFDLRADDPDLETSLTQMAWRVGGDVNADAPLSLRLSAGQVTNDRAEIDGGLTVNAAQSRRDFTDLIALYRAGAVQLTGGLSFERNDIETQPQFAAPLTRSESQRAAYVIGQLDLGQHMVATGAVRVDDYDGFGANTTYSLGAVATYGAFRAFVSYGTAFKAPSLSERYEVSMFNIGNPDLAPEKSASWEIGADWRPNGYWRAGFSYYETRIDHLIEYDFFALQNINVGEAEINGAEAYVSLAPADWGDFRLSYAWTDARNGLTGAQLARRPENTWRFDAHLRAGDRTTLALNWSYVGARTDVTYDDLGQFLNPAGRVDAFTLGAVAASFDLDARAQIFLRISNVTDETYEQPAAFAGAPRNVMFGIRAAY
ncbi:TonB-dependent receptor domain-containing protein [Terricaulis sp.]|uniref:TonB-dependent receptor domain-containing protein n=1 Tax=Terricaulis sp. TaxID=2768686 RepID=UPI0037839832